MTEVGSSDNRMTSLSDFESRWSRRIIGFTDNSSSSSSAKDITDKLRSTEIASDALDTVTKTVRQQLLEMSEDGTRAELSSPATSSDRLEVTAVSESGFKVDATKRDSSEVAETETPDPGIVSHLEITETSNRVTDDRFSVAEISDRNEDAVVKITGKLIQNFTTPGTTDTLNQSTAEILDPSTTGTRDQRTREILNPSTTETPNQSTTENLNQSTTATLNQSTTETLNQSTTETLNQSTTETLNQSTTETFNQNTTRHDATVPQLHLKHASLEVTDEVSTAATTRSMDGSAVPINADATSSAASSSPSSTIAATSPFPQKSLEYASPDAASDAVSTTIVSVTVSSAPSSALSRLIATEVPTSMTMSQSSTSHSTTSHVSSLSSREHVTSTTQVSRSVSSHSEAVLQMSQTLSQMSNSSSETSKTMPRTSQTMSQTSETTSQTSQTKSQTSETTPQTSKSMPRSSKTMSQTSETTSQTSKTMPQTSETMPQLSKTMPQTSETTLQTMPQTLQPSDPKSRKLGPTSSKSLTLRSTAFNRSTISTLSSLVGAPAAVTMFQTSGSTSQFKSVATTSSFVNATRQFEFGGGSGDSFNLALCIGLSVTFGVIAVIAISIALYFFLRNYCHRIHCCCSRHNTGTCKMAEAYNENRQCYHELMQRRLTDTPDLISEPVHAHRMKIGPRPGSSSPTDEVGLLERSLDEDRHSLNDLDQFVFEDSDLLAQTHDELYPSDDAIAVEIAAHRTNDDSDTPQNRSSSPRCLSSSSGGRRRSVGQQPDWPPQLAAEDPYLMPSCHAHTDPGGPGYRPYHEYDAVYVPHHDPVGMQRRVDKEDGYVTSPRLRMKRDSPYEVVRVNAGWLMPAGQLAPPVVSSRLAGHGGAGEGRTPGSSAARGQLEGGASVSPSRGASGGRVPGDVTSVSRAPAWASRARAPGGGRVPSSPVGNILGSRAPAWASRARVPASPVGDTSGSRAPAWASRGRAAGGASSGGIPAKGVSSDGRVSEGPALVSTKPRRPFTPAKVTSEDRAPVTPARIFSRDKAPGAPVAPQKVFSENKAIPFVHAMVSHDGMAPVAPIRMSSETRTPAAPTKISSETRTPAAPTRISPEARTPAAPTRISSETRTLAAPTRISSETRTPAAPTKISSETRTPAAPTRVSSETRTPAAPTRISSETRTPATPIRVSSETRTPAAPTRVSPEDRAPVAPTRISSETRTLAAPTRVLPEDRAPVAPTRVSSRSKRDRLAERRLPETPATISETAPEETVPRGTCAKVATLSSRGPEYSCVDFGARQRTAEPVSTTTTAVVDVYDDTDSDSSSKDSPYESIDFPKKPDS